MDKNYFVTHITNKIHQVVMCVADQAGGTIEFINRCDNTDVTLTIDGEFKYNVRILDGAARQAFLDTVNAALGRLIPKAIKYELTTHQ